MKKTLLICTIILVSLTQCEEGDTDPVNQPVSNMFNMQLHADDLVDTATFGHPNQVTSGYSFAYDQLKRVTLVQIHQYHPALGFWDTLMNCSFNYNANELSPASIDLWWQSWIIEHAKVYFFYNADGSKNRDSIIHITTPQRAVRSFRYDSLFRYVNASTVDIGSAVAVITDSASFSNNNMDNIYSKTAGSGVGYPYIVQSCWYAPQRKNPMTKLNIFPALFLSNYITAPDRFNNLTANNGFIDFNNLNLVDSMSSGGTGMPTEFIKYVSSVYDNKGRIIKRSYFVNPPSSELYEEQYHYKNP